MPFWGPVKRLGARNAAAVRHASVGSTFDRLLHGAGKFFSQLVDLSWGSLLIGLVFVVPMLGHASWHAYRDLVDASSLVERLPPKEAS